MWRRAEAPQVCAAWHGRARTGVHTVGRVRERGHDRATRQSEAADSKRFASGWVAFAGHPPVAKGLIGGATVAVLVVAV
jgi:hypothetical protein